MDRATRQIALFGSHDHDFVDKLQTAGHRPVPYASYSDFKSSSTRHHAIAIANDYRGLSNISELRRLLDADYVLLAFAPSPAFLQALHKATQTPVDISALKLGERRPLMVFKVGGVVKINVQSPPHSEIRPYVVLSSGERKDFPIISRPDEPFNFQHTVKFLTKAMSEVAYGQIRASDDSTVYDLTPPGGTSYFKTCSYSCNWPVAIDILAWTSDGSYGVTTTDTTKMQTFVMVWTVTFYIYATGADPSGVSSSDYTGTIYTFAVHDGQLSRDDDDAGRWFGANSSVEGVSECAFYFMDCLSYSLVDSSSSMTKVAHQPDTNQYTAQDDKKYRYDIDYTQSMAMYKDNGTQNTSFSAHYKLPITQDRFMMHSLTPNNSNLGFSVDYKDYYDHWSDPDYSTHGWWEPGVFDTGKDPVAVQALPKDNLPFRGLTVFKSSVGSYSLDLPCDFNLAAFKSHDWKTDSDDDVGHYQVACVAISSTDPMPLDLTWPAEDSDSD